MTKPQSTDVVGKTASNQGGFYSDTVKEHFFNPKNFLEDETGYQADGTGMVGSPACGDVMRVWIKVDPKTGRIAECKWKTFGCASAIAATSMMSVMASENGGMTLEEARGIKPQQIMERLGGLPARKIHCSVLGDKALRAAINDYYRKTGQVEKVEVEQGRIIDKVLKITDHDIEEAVLDGANTLEKVQAKTKVGLGDPSCIPEVEQLIRFYREKYFSPQD